MSKGEAKEDRSKEQREKETDERNGEIQLQNATALGSQFSQANRNGLGKMRALAQ
jgi:hypothetical protein